MGSILEDLIIEKTYLLEDLIVNPQQVVKRCKFIEDLCQNFDFLPETHFEFKDDRIIYRQQKIAKQNSNHMSFEEKYSYLYEFAKGLDKLTKTGFIHGDIKTANVLFNKEKLWLVDLEPALRQRRQGRITLIYTPPYISLSDLKNDRLTHETDKIGFYFFVQRFFDPTYKLENVHTLMKKRIEENFELFTIPEKRFLLKSFEEILDHIYKNYFF
mgnify:CR=1 FL=1